LLGDRALVDAVLNDYTTAPISEAERALFHLIDKIATDSTKIRQSDIDAAKAAGLADETLYDAITVCSLFQFYNTWIDATGVHDLPAAAYDSMATRMATGGYAPD
jgi:alkylhydroperoxidase family enzyme